VGPAVERHLRRAGVERPEDLRGADADDLFERLCARDGQRLDPCLLDTFAAAVAFVTDGDDRPWWELSRERKAAGHA
jgi:Pathogenicity locus